jgi:hypothetical protein
MECWFGREESDPRLYWQKLSQSEEDRKLKTIIRRLRGLFTVFSVRFRL